MLKGSNRRALWRNHMFRQVWAAQGVSVLGSRVTMFALPLTAATLLHASSLQMGLLGFAQFGPLSPRPRPRNGSSVPGRTPP